MIRPADRWRRVHATADTRAPRHPAIARPTIGAAGIAAIALILLIGSVLA